MTFESPESSLFMPEVDLGMAFQDFFAAKPPPPHNGIEAMFGDRARSCSFILDGDEYGVGYFPGHVNAAPRPLGKWLEGWPLMGAPEGLAAEDLQGLRTLPVRHVGTVSQSRAELEKPEQTFIFQALGSSLLSDQTQGVVALKCYAIEIMHPVSTPAHVLPILEGRLKDILPDASPVDVAVAATQINVQTPLVVSSKLLGLDEISEIRKLLALGKECPCLCEGDDSGPLS
ncbi:MAG TPA: hypothetical protein VHD60_00730 [Candidatus Saccharimonadales bacterium]|nr:hypothetical protein [Candidatus Saccharimonadales bacterium]